MKSNEVMKFCLSVYQKISRKKTMSNVVESQILLESQKFFTGKYLQPYKLEFSSIGDLFDHFLLEYCLQNKKSLISPVTAVRRFLKAYFFKALL